MNDTPFDILLDGDTQIPQTVIERNPNVRIRSVEDVLQAKDRYQVLVSNHPIRIPHAKKSDRKVMIKRLAETNLRMMYAAGKSRWNMSDWNRFYDGILCFGPHHAQAYSEKFGLNTIEIGYPRFDRYFNAPADRTELCARYNCDPDKKTIVWLPTWKALSSVDHFNDEISALTESYNVVTKVHPLMPADEPQRVARLRNIGLNSLIEDTSDNVPLYQLADYMLFDYGGPAFGAIYTDKKFVLLNVPNAADDELSGADSPDVLLRQSLINVDAGTGSLTTYLRDGPHWDAHMTEIERLRKTYFAEKFGTSAKAAAHAILDRSWLTDKGAM
ncbi:MAG: CDP-glycerol glycerophosphotransferase family protein [Pseudomonadota bacterium]